MCDLLGCTRATEEPASSRTTWLETPRPRLLDEVGQRAREVERGAAQAIEETAAVAAEEGEVAVATHSARVSVDGYTLTLAANAWNIVRAYNLTPGRELLFACRYRLGAASNFVVYMSEADNVYDPLYGSFVGAAPPSRNSCFSSSAEAAVSSSASTLLPVSRVASRIWRP